MAEGPRGIRDGQGQRRTDQVPQNAEGGRRRITIVPLRRPPHPVRPLEGDTIEGAGKYAYVVRLVDRKSCFTCWQGREQEQGGGRRVIEELLARLSSAMRRT